jgi:hypothetical protein
MTPTAGAVGTRHSASINDAVLMRVLKGRGKSTSRRRIGSRRAKSNCQGYMREHRSSPLNTSVASTAYIGGCIRVSDVPSLALDCGEANVPEVRAFARAGSANAVILNLGIRINQARGKRCRFCRSCQSPKR